MGIEGIINKINSEADIEIHEIERKTEKTIEDIRAEVAKYELETLEKAHERAITEAERRFNQVKNREETELRKRMLEIKQELITEVFDKAKKAVMSLPEEKLKEIYCAMLASFGVKNGEIVAGKAERNIFDDQFRSLIANEIPESDFSILFSNDFDHGFMLIAGKIQFDARVSQVFSELTERATDRVATILFSES